MFSTYGSPATASGYAGTLDRPAELPARGAAAQRWSGPVLGMSRSSAKTAPKDGGATADERSLGDRFEAVAAILRELDMDRLWREATERERRTLVDELVEAVFIFTDHLEVEDIGAPRLNVRPSLGNNV